MHLHEEIDHYLAGLRESAVAAETESTSKKNSSTILSSNRSHASGGKIREERPTKEQHSAFNITSDGSQCREEGSSSLLVQKKGDIRT